MNKGEETWKMLIDPLNVKCLQSIHHVQLICEFTFNVSRDNMRPAIHTPRGLTLQSRHETRIGLPMAFDKAHPTVRGPKLIWEIFIYFSKLSCQKVKSKPGSLHQCMHLDKSFLYVVLDLSYIALLVSQQIICVCVIF